MVTTALYWRQFMSKRLDAVGTVPDILQHMQASLEYHKRKALLYDEQISHLKSDDSGEISRIYRNSAGYPQDEFSMLSTTEEILQVYRDSTALALVYAGIGMLAYGNLEVLDEIINYLPRPIADEGAVSRNVGFALKGILPLPKYLDDISIRKHPEELREWFQENRDRLIWSEKQGKYVIRDME